MATSKIIGTIKDTGWINIPAGDASDYEKVTLTTAKYRQVNNIVFISIYNTGSPISSGWKNFGKMPAGTRPSIKLFASGSNRSGAGYEIQLETGGNIYLNSNSDITFTSLMLSYPAN